MKKHMGVLGLLLVAIIWGSGFVASDFALKTLTPMEILFSRFFIAAGLMSIISFKKWKLLHKKTLISGIILGVFLYIAFAFQTIGLQYTTPSKNAFLTATNVIIVPFIAWIIYKKKVDAFSLIGAFLAIVGIGLLSLTNKFTLGLGDGLTLISAVGFALHIFFTSAFVKKYDFILLTALQMVVACLLSLIGLLFTGGFPIHFETSGMVSVLYLGVISTTVAFFLQTFSQKYTDETKAAIVLSMESVFGTLFSIILVHERITPRMIAGCIIILGAVLIAETKLSFLFPKKAGETSYGNH